MFHRQNRPRATVPPRLVGVLLVVAFALTAVACDPAVLNARLDDYGDGATSTSLNSGSKGASVALPDGRVVFLANDVYTGALDGNGNRPNATKVANAFVVGNGLDPDAPLQTKIGSGNTAWLKPPTAGNSYTLLSAAISPGSSDFQVFAVERNASGATVGFRIIKVLQSTLQRSGTPVSLVHHDGGPEWGAHVIRNEYDDHWYIYGTGSSGAATYVARARFGFLTSEPDWQYWTGSAWSAVEGQVGPLRDEAGNVVAQYLTPTLHDLSPTVPDDHDRVVFLGRGTGSGGNSFFIASAARPQGPVTVKTPAIYQAATESCGSGGTVLASSISSHPHLSDDSANAVFSYARRCSVANTKASIDRPRFFSIDLGASPSTPRWRAAWTSAMARANANFSHPTGFAADRTLRQVVHTSRGGSTVRIRLSNKYGTAPLVIGAASVGISAAAAGTTAAVTATPTPVTFAGQASVRIPVGQSIRSDAVTLPVALPADHDVAVSLSFPDGATSPTAHQVALETSHLAAHSGADDKVLAVTAGQFGALSPPTDNGYFLTGVDVVDDASGGTVVGFGDSLTDGMGTSNDAEQRWTNVLHDQLAGVSTPVRNVVNMGYSGRTLLPWGETYPYSAPAAFDEEVLGQPGIRTVIIWIGINDLNRYKLGLSSPTANQMRAALEDMVDRGQAAGVRVVLATITPLRGSDPNAALAPTESIRLQVNTWIRQGALGADAFVDFDQAVRDPADWTRVYGPYSFGGGNHLTPQGYAAVADKAFEKRTSL